jgi:hypothetical protein
MGYGGTGRESGEQRNRQRGKEAKKAKRRRGKGEDSELTTEA